MSARIDALARAVVDEDRWQREALAEARKAAWAEQVARGVAWPDLAVVDAIPGRRGAWRWVVRARAELPERPGAGDAVDVMPVGATAGRWRGRVRGVDGAVAELDVFADDEPPPFLRVALRHDPVTTDRQLAALQGLRALPGPLAALLRGDAAWSPPERLEAPVGPLAASLDPSQRDAVARALAADALAVVFGPPGTGKTRTVVALLGELVARGERPWALADSNAAVDHLAVTASAAGLDVVRLGSPARVGGAAAALTVDARVRAHPLAEAVAALERDVGRLRKVRTGAGRKALVEALRARDALVDQARAEILAHADVLATTLGTLPRVAERLPRARTAVVDEATQATEPSVIVATPWVERIVLAGDPHQLGPVVMQPGNPLGRGLLQRLQVDAPALVEGGRLRVQRRMHPDLARLVEDVYGDAFTSDPSTLAHALPDAGDDDPAVFVDTAGAGLDDERCALTGSWRNPGEARVIAAAVARWRARGVPAEHIGVITPYSAQVALLRSTPGLEGVEVSTVNGFQGREKEAIAVSLVRSNADGVVGFAAERERLTVALTRARRALVVVADTATVGAVPWVARLAETLAARGRLRTVWEPPWDLA